MRQSVVLDQLRARIAGIEQRNERHPSLPFGVDAIDRVLPSGGIAGGALHEIAGGRALADDAAATIFLAGILARQGGTIVWCLQWRDLFAPALDRAGLSPDRVIFVEAGSDTNILIALEESLRHPGLGAVVGEIRKASLTATRRLLLAAERSGVAAFLFRRAATSQAQEPSAAVTRWRIRAVPSQSLDMPSLSRSRWEVALERARGGDAHQWIVESCDAQGRIALPAELVDRPLAQEDRQAAA